MTSQSEHKSNSENVRRYYKRHRSLVLVRKILRRAKRFGAVPSAKSVLDHSVPMTALATEFAEWCKTGHTPEKLSKQRRKLEKLCAILKKIQPQAEHAEPVAASGGVLASVPTNQASIGVTSAA